MGIFLRESRDRSCWNIKVSHNGSERILIRKREIKSVGRVVLEKILHNEDKLEKIQAKLLLESTDAELRRQFEGWVVRLLHSNAKQLLVLEMINGFVRGWAGAKKFWDQIEISLRKKDPQLLEELLTTIKILFRNFNRLSEIDRTEESITWLFDSVGSEIFFFTKVSQNEQLVANHQQVIYSVNQQGS